MKQSKYLSKKPNPQGFVDYTDEENATWHDLYVRQIQLIQRYACDEVLQGIEALEITAQQIPQLPDVNARLRELTGWEVAAVPALIDFQHFFELMANKKFPAATFIRTPAEMDYLQEPDIFHEIFGHCPLLTLPVFADFVHEYAKLGLKANHADRVMLARLYWFTVEFGLIETPKGRKVYGGGILSSFGETQYALDSDKPLRKPLTPLDAFRTPYRIDIYQPLYYVLRDFQQLFSLTGHDLMALIGEARALGMYAPLFTPKAQGDITC